jgi:hypothetical protein
MKSSVYSVRVFERPAIEIIVRFIETILWEPDDITDTRGLGWTV